MRVVFAATAFVFLFSGVASETAGLKNSKMVTNLVHPVRAVQTDEPKQRFLRSTKHKEDGEERVSLSIPGLRKTKWVDHFTPNKLENMLVNIKFQDEMFAIFKKMELPAEKLKEMLNLKKHPHLETLYHQYVAFLNPTVSIFKNV